MLYNVNGEEYETYDDAQAALRAVRNEWRAENEVVAAAERTAAAAEAAAAAREPAGEPSEV